jgi:hypothetical protein
MPQNRHTQQIRNFITNIRMIVYITPKGNKSKVPYTAEIKAVNNEYEVKVGNFPFKRVFGKSIQNAKDNFKLQVESVYFVEVVWA